MNTFVNKHLPPLKNFMTVVGSVCLILILYTLLNMAFSNRSNDKDDNINHLVAIVEDEATLSYNHYKYELVKDVQRYIDSVAPTSSLTAITLVNCCEQYDLDVKFVMAQAQVESHFGTTGVARKTNNVFNVGAYDGVSSDNIHKKFKYKHPDYSIEPYMKLLYKNYINENGNELMLLNNYVTRSGKRYASSKEYEAHLRSVYKYIDTRTGITYLQGEMNKFKLIIGC